MALLEVQHLQKIYTTRFGGNPVQALSNVNFSVEAGEYVAIMGESGSGKTTLLNILAALDRPTAGEVLLDGQASLCHPGAGSGGLPPVPPGLRVPGLQPAGHLLPSGQHLPAPGAGGHRLSRRCSKQLQPHRGAAGHRGHPGQIPLRGLRRPEAAGRCGPGPHHGPPDRSWQTSPPALWTPGPRTACWSCSENSTARGQTILMVTHSVKAASHAGRVLFLRDGEVYHQLYRGGESQESPVPPDLRHPDGPGGRR